MKFELGDYAQMISAAESGYNRYRGAFIKLDNCYLMQFEQDVLDQLKDLDKPIPIYTPSFNSKAKRIMASFESAYFESDEIAQVSNNNGKVQREADAIDLELKDQTRSGMFAPMQRCFLDTIVKGTAIIRSYWTDKLNIEHIQVKDLWFDPSALSHKDLRFVVHRTYSTIPDIAELQQQGIYNNDFDPNTLVKQAYQEQTPFSKVVLYDVYFLDAGVWKLTTLYDRTIILRENIILNDGLPFTFGICLPQPISELDTRAVMSYGDSPMSPMISNQAEINIRRNQMIEAIELSLKPRALVMSGSGLDPMDMHKGAGSMIRVTNPNAVQWIPAPSIQSAIFDIQRLDTEGQEAVGVTAYNSGNDMGQMMNRTATGIATLTQEGNTRIASYLRSFNETMMEPLFDRIVKLIWKYSDSDNFDGIDRSQDIEFKISINVGLGATNKQVQLNGMMQAVQLIAQTGNTKAVTEIIRRTLPLLGIKDVDEVMGADNEESGFTGTPQPQSMGGNQIPTQQAQEQPFDAGANGTVGGAMQTLS
ncbi:MAG: hypothetical protein JHC33_04945 [Ignisphaera sp.]|nr:hypothetical protein [Ignisphaera sp.]